MLISFTCPHCNEKLTIKLPLPEDESYSKPINFPCPKCVRGIGILKESLDKCRLEKTVVKHPTVLASQPTDPDKENVSLAILCPHCHRHFFGVLEVLSHRVKKMLASGKFAVSFICPNCQKSISEIVPVADASQVLSPENPTNLTPKELEKLQRVFGRRFPKDSSGPPSPKAPADPISEAEASKFAQELEASDVPPKSELLGE